LNNVKKPCDSPAQPNDSHQPKPLTRLRRHHRFILPRMPVRPSIF
jgi:hypothetical protein